MAALAFLILFPLIPSSLLFCTRNEKFGAFVVRFSSVSIAAASIYLSFRFFNGVFLFGLSEYEFLNMLMLGVEILIGVYIVVLGVKHRRFPLVCFAVVQMCVLLGFEFGSGKHIDVVGTLMVDKLSIIMVLIVGIIGGLICLYSVEYMKDHHKYHPSPQGDRKNVFFSVLFLFLSAMFGLVLSNHLLWMLFFWEITSLCSFWLIGYPQTEEARKNAFYALTINVGGGLAFAVGIVLIALHYGILDFDTLLSIQRHSGVLLLGVFLMALAGLTKSAQLPFSRWLLGAMVAPTPSSAMLHSSTMVKAGVYLIIRLSPMLGDNYIGIVVTLVGSFTFLTTAMIAISQSDAKKILAYSTLSNLGLIITCAAIGTQESLWAAVMLIIFHAIAKSLLFLAVGSTEHKLGSRNVEDMDGLLNISGQLTMYLIIGIAGMFLAPFGMLISKWAAMKAFVDSGNVLIVLMVAFGSSVTLFFWTKWMGKLVENYSKTKVTDYEMRGDELIPLNLLSFMVVVACFCYPLISSYAIIPYLKDIYFAFPVAAPLNRLDMTITRFMMVIIFILPLVLIPIYRWNKVKSVSVYLAGQNAGDNKSFYGSAGKTQTVEHANWYMKKYFGEKTLLKKCMLLSAVMLVIGFYIALEGLLV